MTCRLTRKDCLCIAYFRNGMIEHALQTLEQQSADHQSIESIQASELLYGTLISYAFKNKEQRYHNLCRRSNSMALADESKMKCYYLGHSSGSIILNDAINLMKIKTEEISIHPNILFFHSIIFHNDAEAMIEDSASNIEYKNGLVYHQRAHLSNTTKGVVRSSVAWFENDAHLIAIKIHSNLKLIRG